MRTTKLCSLILEKIQTPGATLMEIAELIQSDRCLTERIISLVNRSYCSAPGGVSDLCKALQYIGNTTLIQLLITFKML